MVHLTGSGKFTLAPNGEGSPLRMGRDSHGQRESSETLDFLLDKHGSCGRMCFLSDGKPVQASRFGAGGGGGGSSAASWMLGTGAES